jgi:membrane protein DedA with SNARE-associated domain
MSLFVDYVAPLKDWLQHYPHWALLITFLISLAESLAIIGSIVPGSVTMTAIGMLAGSGAMRIDLTLIAATLGAVAGDSLSYALGYVYSDRLTDIWPFKKYPSWIKYGKDFFELHGGKSVLIGRFVGPLRSIIPVIAGIMHMPQWRFLIANFLSAVGWSLLYVMPGVLIGAASHELSVDSATHLFVIILILLGALWLLSLMIKWLVVKLSNFFKSNLHNFWLNRLKRKSLFSPLCRAITPKSEKNHDTTASLVLITLFCFSCFIAFTGLTLQGEWLNAINTPTHLFIQSFHSLVLAAFFIFCTQLTSTITIVCLFIVSCCWFIYSKNYKAIIYCSGLIFFSVLLVFILSHFIYTPRPPGLLVLMTGSSYPAAQILVASAFYGFILFYINSIYSPFTNTLRTFVFSILGLSGFGALYLGDYWLTDVLASYFAGASIGLFCCLLYRRWSIKPMTVNNAVYMILSLFACTLFGTIISTYLNFHTLSYNHTPYHKEFVLDETAWWNQKRTTLPIYRLNRIGKRISLFNIEYAGDLTALEAHLSQKGWTTHTESFFSNLLTWINSQPTNIKLPLLTQLYENKAPSLSMVYTDSKSNLILELRIWESNYNFSNSKKPLWIGSLHPRNPINRAHNNVGYTPNLINPLDYLLNIQSSFNVRKIILPDEMVKSTTYPTQPYIILIRQKV